MASGEAQGKSPDFAKNSAFPAWKKLTSEEAQGEGRDSVENSVFPAWRKLTSEEAHEMGRDSVENSVFSVPTQQEPPAASPAAYGLLAVSQQPLGLRRCRFFSGNRTMIGY